MKFSEIEENKWPELEPFLDTCLLPLTGLTGLEKPWEATHALEDLQFMMDLVEIPFKGRVVTYPAVHYASAPAQYAELVEQMCTRLKQSGFRFVICITAKPEIGAMQVTNADLMISPLDLPEEAVKARQKVGELITSLWRNRADVTNS